MSSNQKNSFLIRDFRFTYGDGLLKDDGGGLTQDYTWEGEDIRSISTTNGSVVLDFETSDAPAQAMFELLSYDTGLSELCAQGCFGTLPAHMPSKRTMTTTLLPGMPPFVSTYHYNYTLNADGRLATVEATNESDNKTTTHTLTWEER